MNDKFFDAWDVETTDLTSRVAAAIGTVPPPVELIEEIRALRREIAELRMTTAILGDEVARLRQGATVRRIVPFGAAGGRLS